MGCGDACPIYPGKRYLDWELADPAGQDLEAVRTIRDDIDARVRPCSSSSSRRGLRTCRWADSSAGHRSRSGRDQRDGPACRRARGRTD